ncbi:MAG: oligosaccharide flippase family protein [Candidatus Aenigmarchaeota archaeon]|nr:oligosaccharide flippase family protein [Candidatus Aenigmarchaeota archaeon]
MNNDLSRVKRKLVSNTFYLFLDYSTVSVFSLIFWASAGKFLLPAEYGIASLSINLVVLFASLAGLGLSVALSKLLPEYLEKNQIDKTKKLIKFSLIIVLFSSLLLSGLFFLLSPQLSLNLPNHIILFLSVLIVFTALSQIILGILSGYQNMKGLFFTDMLSNVSKLLLSIFLMFLGFNYLGPIFGFGIGILMVSLLRFRLLPRLNLPTKGLDKKNVFFEYAIPSFIVGISTILLTNGQIAILGLLKNPEITGIFSVAFIVSNVLVMIFRIMSRALLPITSQLSVRKDSDKMQGYFINLVLRYGLLISIPILIFFTLFADNLILIFSSKEYLSASSLVPILSVASVLYGISIVLNSSIYAIGKPKIQQNISIVSSIIFLLLAVPLTLMFSANGMSYSYLIYSVILVALGIYNIKKYLEVKLPLESFYKIMVSGIVSFALLFTFLIFTRNIIESIAFAIISGLTYITILIVMRFVTSDDVKVLSFFANRLPIFKRQFVYIINKIPKS